MSEQLAAVFGDENRIGMTETADSLQVDSRLNADHHILSENIGAALRDPGAS